MEAIGILGGTFDPIHFAHLRIAFEIRQALGLTKVKFLPCANPPHRSQAIESFAKRVAMLELAIENEPAFSIDDREYARLGPSYTFDSLNEMRSELGQNVSLCLLVGSDAFADFDSWYRWQEILDLANIVIAQRPGKALWSQGRMGEMVQKNITQDGADIRECSAGKIFSVAVTQLDISATLIRKLIAQKEVPKYLLPDAVWEKISNDRLYSAKPKDRVFGGIEYSG